VYDKIVVGYYKSITGREALKQATALADTLDADLHLVTSFGPDAWEDAERHLASKKFGSVRTLETHAVGGDIADVLVEVADQVGADLIIVGNKDLHGSKRVRDSVAGAVSAKASCAVLIVPTT
jgi:nucleotide-binding universal stress UspA family protein